MVALPTMLIYMDKAHRNRDTMNQPRRNRAAERERPPIQNILQLTCGGSKCAWMILRHGRVTFKKE